MRTVGLSQAQASCRELGTGCRDASLFDADGTLRRSAALRVLGPWGRSVLRRLLSRLTGRWRVAADLSAPVAWGVKAPRIRLLAGLQGAEPRDRSGARRGGAGPPVAPGSLRPRFPRDHVCPLA